VTLINEEENSNFQLWRSGNWSNIVYNKFKIIYENLLVEDYVCITDGDVVFENNKFLDYLLQNCKDNEMLVQNDTLRNKTKKAVCSGFMFIKSTPNTINLFNPINVEKNRNKEGWGDQIYVNDIKKKLKYNTLPLQLYPNGGYYFKYYREIKPYMIHFNWLLGNKKLDKMKGYGKWFLE